MWVKNKKRVVPMCQEVLRVRVKAWVVAVRVTKKVTKERCVGVASMLCNQPKYLHQHHHWSQTSPNMVSELWLALMFNGSVGWETQK